MSEKYYRLLDGDEEIKLGDEFYCFSDREWCQVKGLFGSLAKAAGIVRRPYTPAPVAWVAISERPPEFPCVVGACGVRAESPAKWVTAFADDPDFLSSTWTHWTPLPPPPPNPDEQAFEKWLDGRWECKEMRPAFLAGRASLREEKARVK